jgi:hypothetical protein
LEKSLVEILHEYKYSGCRGDNGWNSEGWNRMVKEFHTEQIGIIHQKTSSREERSTKERLQDAESGQTTKWVVLE